MLIADAFLLSKSLDNKSCYNQMSHNLKFNGFAFATINPSSLDLVEYGNRLYESFLQKWQFDIEYSKSGNKLRFYANIKESFGFD